MPSHPLAELRRAARVGPPEFVPVLIGPAGSRPLTHSPARRAHCPHKPSSVRTSIAPSCLRSHSEAGVEPPAEPNTAAECRIMHDVKGVRRGRLSAAWAGVGRRSCDRLHSSKQL